MTVSIEFKPVPPRIPPAPHPLPPPKKPASAMYVPEPKSGVFRDTPLRQRERALENALGFTFQSGNDIRVLKNGDEIFPAMLGAIRDAQHFIGFVTFVYWQGDIARQFATALADAARRGVVVMVILDAVGAAEMSEELVEQMKSAGVRISWFRPKSAWRVWRTSHRTHRKVLVVDFEVAFTGGVGIAQEWCGDARNENEWRDTHLELRGPVVTGLWAAFTGNWMEQEVCLPDGWNAGKEQRTTGASRALIVQSTASVGFSDIATLFRTLASLSQRRLRIATPYFVPDEYSIELLKKTVARGVEVTLLLPGSNTDKRLVQIVNEPILRKVMEAGVQVYEFQPTMMHAKIILVDNDLSAVGSANINHRSLRKDDEVMVVSSDRTVASELHQHFEEDLDRSRRKRLEDLKRLPWYRTLLHSMLAWLRSEL